jgi:hypothetical protein
MLPQLPSDILDQIISCFPDHDDREDNFKTRESSMGSTYGPSARGNEEDNLPFANLESLRNLCLVSKAMFQVARRHLYTQFIWGSTESTSLRQFLINILKEPYLARQLRYICYRNPLHCAETCWLSTKDYDAYAQSNAQYSEQCTPESESLIIEKASNLSGLCFAGNKHQIPFLEHLRRRCSAAQLILLICHAPNLEILNIGVGSPESRTEAKIWVTELTLQLLNSVTSSELEFVNPLSKIRKLVLEGTGSGDDIWFDLRPWVPIASLPSFRSMHTYASRYSLGSVVTKIPLQHLRLINTAQMSSDDIYEIIDSCIALKELKVTHSRFVLNSLVDTRYTTSHKCLEVLQDSKDSLEILDWPIEIRSRRLLLELAHFTKLRAVNVSISAFYDEDDDVVYPNGPDWAADLTTEQDEENYLKFISEGIELCFPASIEHVTVTYCTEWPIPEHPVWRSDTVRALKAFAGVAKSRLTRLSKVTFVHGYECLDEASRLNLTNSFSAIGVQFIQQKEYWGQATATPVPAILGADGLWTSLTVERYGPAQ